MAACRTHARGVQVPRRTKQVPQPQQSVSPVASPQQPVAHDPTLGYLERLHQLWINNLLWALAALGIILLVLAHFASHLQKDWAWVRSIPLNDLGIAALTACFVGLVFERLSRREADAQSQERIRQIIQPMFENLDERVAKRQLIDASLFRDALHDVAHQVIDERLVDLLEVRLNDRSLAQDAAKTMLMQLLTYPQRHIDYRLTATLTLEEHVDPVPIATSTSTLFYLAFIELHYMTTALQRDRLVFIRVPTIADYNALLKDDMFEHRWVEEDHVENPISDPAGFSLEYAEVGGIALEIAEENNTHGRCLVGTDPSGRVSAMLGKPATIRYKYRVRVQRIGHLLMFNVQAPTRGVTIELDYAGTDIRHMNVYDFFDSPAKPTIRYLPTQTQAHRIEVRLDEWVFPKSGVVFGWVLSAETAPGFRDMLDATRSTAQKEPARGGVREDQR
jgi:hypothetical protein